MKLIIFKRISGLFFLLNISFITSAQDNIQGYDSLLSKELSEVVISANRHGSVQIRTPEAIRVLDVKTVQRQQLRTAPEALSVSPGIFVQKTNHGGGSPFIRGLTGNQTLLLIDGIRLSNSIVRYGPNQYFNTIDIFSTGKFEVMRGSGSVQYGSDAIGGTIQAFTPDLHLSDKTAWNGTAIARVSTHGMEQTAHGNIRYSGNKAALRAGATARNFGDLLGGDTTGRQHPTGYGEFDFDIKGLFKITRSSDLTVLLQRVHQSDVPVYHKVVLENYEINRMNPQQRMLGYVRLNQKISSGILNSVVFTASYQQGNETRESRKNGSAVLRSENDRVKTYSLSADLLAGKGAVWSANTGFELYNDRVNSNRLDFNLISQAEDLKRGLYPDGSSMTSLALYSLHTFDLLKWNITGGARINSYINNVEDQDLGTVTLKPAALVGNIALLRKINNTSSLFISAANGFRAPNIDDLGTLGIVDFRYETPNFSLQPEHSFQYQAGYKLQGKRLHAELFLYRNELYNLIVRNRMPGDTIEGYPVYSKENVERAFIRGLETAWDLHISRSFVLSWNLTTTVGQNLTRNEPVRRIPPLFGNLSANYRKEKWSFGVEWLAAAKQDRLAQGDRDDNRIPSGGTPGWNVINLRAGCIVKKITIDLSLINILNEDYRYHGSGVNGTGRSAFLSIAVDL